MQTTRTNVMINFERTITFRFCLYILSLNIHEFLYKRLFSSVQKNWLFCTEENNLLYNGLKMYGEWLKKGGDWLKRTIREVWFFKEECRFRMIRVVCFFMAKCRFRIINGVIPKLGITPFIKPFLRFYIWSLFEIFKSQRCNFTFLINLLWSYYVYARSTTVIPAPPNCTCSSWKWATPWTVCRYWRISWRRIPVPVPWRIRTLLIPTRMASSTK